MVSLDQCKLVTSDRQNLFSTAFTEAIITASGFNISNTKIDRNSDDVFAKLGKTVFDDDIEQYPIHNELQIQVKCTFNPVIDAEGIIHYQLDRKNYNDLRLGREPKILVLVIVPNPNENSSEPWIECQDNNTILRHKAYWKSIMGYEPIDGDHESKMIYIPTSNIFTIQSLCNIMENNVIGGQRL
jgi:hypothetical protein